MQNSKRTMHNWFLAFCILFFVFCISGCSIPNLEKPECSAAREPLKQFYSWHHGTDADVRQLERDRFATFISPSFAPDPKRWDVDPFFLTKNWPTGFRVGSCKVIDPAKVEFQLVLFWRDGEKSELGESQRELVVESVLDDDRWMINKVSRTR